MTQRNAHITLTGTKTKELLYLILLITRILSQLEYTHGSINLSFIIIKKSIVYNGRGLFSNAFFCSTFLARQFKHGVENGVLFVIEV